MKRTKFLVLALAVAIMMMGAGYALWDDLLTVDESIQMGDLAVEWWWNGVKVDENQINHVTAAATTKKGVFSSDVGTDTNANRSPEKNTYTVNFTNVYPGAEMKWDGHLLNTGSLPVRFENLDLVVNSGSELVPYLEVYYDTRHHDVSAGTWGSWNVHDYVPLNNFENEMNNDATLKGYVLDTGDLIQFGLEDTANCIRIRVKEDLPESFMNSKIEFDLNFTLQQAFN